MLDVSTAVLTLESGPAFRYQRICEYLGILFTAPHRCTKETSRACVASHSKLSPLTFRVSVDTALRMAATDLIRAWAAYERNGKLKPFQYEPGPLGEHEVEVAVKYCGLCYSDVHMIKNDWTVTAYPLVPGHEVVGNVSAVGSKVTRVAVGQPVGIGWMKGSCMYCDACLAGAHNLCCKGQETVVGNHGGFADRVRCEELWAIPLPPELDEESVGPFLCAGGTMFTPLLNCGIRGTDRVGVIGIGGLGHIALMFLKSWGCHVTAFTTSADKVAEAKQLGAHEVVVSTDSQALKAVENTFDVILSTVSAAIDHSPYFAALKPQGRLHIVGLPPAGSLAVDTGVLVNYDKTLSGSVVSAPLTMKKMLDFAQLHKLKPVVEVYPMREVNEAIKRLESGKARYRIVLKN